MKEKVIKVIKETIRENFSDYKDLFESDINENTQLYGEGACLDSLGLVSLIVCMEESIYSNFNQQIILANEKAMSRKNSPFLNVGRLAEYICELLEEKANGIQ